MDNIQWLDANKRKFVYDLSRDLVWILPGVGGPIGSAIISVIQSYDDPAQSWQTELNQTIIKMGSDLEQFIESYDSRKTLDDIHAHLAEIGSARTTISNQINKYNAISSSDIDGLQKTRDTIVAMINIKYNAIQYKIEQELIHKVTMLSQDNELNKEAGNKYEGHSPFIRTMLKFDTLLIGITAVLVGYKTLIEFSSWKSTFGETQPIAQSQALFALMQSFHREFTASPDPQYKSLLHKISQNIFSNRYISVGEIERDDSVDYSITAQYDYTTTVDTPAAGSRPETTHSSAGFYSSGDNLPFAKYWAFFKAFPLDDAELIARYGSHSVDILKDATQTGRYLPAKIKIQPRVERSTSAPGTKDPIVIKNKDDLNLDSYMVSIPSTWQANKFKDLITGQYYYTMDDCWIAWSLRLLQVRHWTDRRSEAEAKRSLYLEAVKAIAANEFPEGCPENVDRQTAAWKSLCESGEAALNALPSAAPMIEWGKEDALWNNTLVEVRYAISYTNQKAGESGKIFTDWHKACSKRPTLKLIPPPDLSKGFLSIKIYRELKKDNKEYSPPTAAHILMPRLSSAKKYYFEADWEDVIVPVIPS